MTRSARTSTIAELDLQDFFETLECARPLLPPERHSSLDLGRQVFLDMMRLLHQRGTTIAPREAVRRATVHEQFGVTRGTMRTPTVPR